MKYMGSKARFAKDILPIILKDRKPGQWYVEPFCGGCNVIDKVDGKRLASDKNEYLIEMWKGLQNEESRPYDIPKDLYDKARNEYNSRSENQLNKFNIGWIGWMASFNGRFFDGGYSGNYKLRDYISEQIRNTEKQIDNIKDVSFIHCSYDELDIPDNSIIYCDIPYRGTKQYSVSKNFDYGKFWRWCRDMSKGHKIFISEYEAPPDYKCIWEKRVTNAMNTKKTYKPTEKLFCIR